MKNFQNDIDNLVSKILSEEIDSKVRKIMETNGKFDEELTGGQSKIDVAEPKGKITAADFKKLRDAKTHKEEVEEFYSSYDSDEEEAELEIKKIKVEDINYLSDRQNDFNENIFVKVRSTGKLIESKLDVNTGIVTFDKSEFGVSPGQACVFYKPDQLGVRVLGGGWIRATE